jgi:hypothetical protein
MSLYNPCEGVLMKRSLCISPLFALVSSVNRLYISSEEVFSISNVEIGIIVLGLHACPGIAVSILYPSHYVIWAFPGPSIAVNILYPSHYVIWAIPGPSIAVSIPYPSHYIIWAIPGPSIALSTSFSKVQVERKKNIALCQLKGRLDLWFTLYTELT